MNNFVRSALNVCIAALLAACTAPQAPIAAPDAMPQSSAIATHAQRGGSWMLPEAKSANLMYVADPAAGGVLVYTYTPPRFKFVGILSDPNYPYGECVDAAQDVFITNGSVIYEYAHGGAKPIRVLGDPAGVPNSCSVDPATGDLAVTSGSRLGSNAITVAVYKGGKGRPKLYPDTAFNYLLFCGYDKHGDLFVDGGTATSNAFLLAELPRGSDTFTTISVKQAIEYPGGIQWVGKHLTVGDSFQHVLYEFDIKGSRAKEVGSISLTGAINIDQFLVRNARLINPSGNVEGRSGFVDFYSFPAGGSPSRKLPNFGSPYAVVVSTAPSH